MIQMELGDKRLSKQDIENLLEQNADVAKNQKRYKDNLEYYKGNNQYIINRLQARDVKSGVITISYARKIIQTVVGYMYQPGLITYTTENEKYGAVLEDIFKFNHEPIETSQLGKQTSVQGIGFEIHYVDSKEAVPRFSKAPAAQMIPIWDYSIEPELIACMRHYMRGDDKHVYIYYPDEIEHWIKKESASTYELDGAEAHFYKQVPIVVYQNNEEMIGDFESVRDLIDAYDVLMTDSMNEFSRFCFAYLVMRGYSMSSEEADNLRDIRAFMGLDENAQIDFLTKEIPHEYIKFMSEWIKDEIHKQSHVPNFLESKTGDQLSGVAISKALYDFEFVAATKEAYFRKGLEKRIELINEISTIQDKETDAVDIVMSRNEPGRDMENAEIFEKLDGRISRKTLIEEFADFVENADEELEQLDAEEKARMPEIDLDNLNGEAEEN